MADFDVDKFLENKQTEGFDIDKFLQERRSTSLDKSPEEIAGMLAAPAMTAAGTMIPANVGPAAKVAASSVYPYIREVAKGYVSKPLTAAADVGLTAIGAFPVAGPLATLGDRASAVREGMIEASKQASMGSPTLSPVKGVPTTSTIRPYFDMLKSVPSDVASKISDIWNTQGGNNGVKAWLNSAEGQALMKANPEFARTASAYIQATPGMMTQAGRMLKPLAVGAARLAGPAGLAYDVYEAGQHYVPPSGPVAPQMAQARRAMLNAPTPAPLTPTEAQNLLSSGDTRTINIYGGPDKLNQIIRQEAARRIIPVVPQ